MSGESRLPTSGEDRTETSGDVPASAASGHRTPDESTMALPSSDVGALPSSGEDDLPRLAPGERLAGRFEVLRFIARGAMGAVYEAEDVMLRARVALKLIRGRIATDITAMERFRREVLLARRVSHPNVCRVYELYDATTAGGVPIHFLTMELLEGETLSRRISRGGRLSTDEALPLARQMCEGLAAAHAEGVIHRDFKSSNVLLVPRREGSAESSASSTRVVITDFGIARAVEAHGQEKQDGPLTGGAAILGTPEYMAPEQVTGRAVTAATDVYALGVVLYEMVTGKLPFTGDTPLASAARRLNESPPRPELEAPGLDRRWSATILRCLEREPERRFRSALEILPALEQRQQRGRRVASVSGAVIAGTLIGFALVLYILVTSHKKPTAAGVPTAPRPAVAILGFRDELASPELTWLPIALSELLERELAAAETTLRVIPGDRVARVRRSLGVSEDAVNEEKPRERMQALLAANVLAYGTLKPMAPGSASVGLSVKLVDALTGRVLTAVDEDLGEGASAMADKVSSAAERLREALGVKLSQEQSASLSVSRWHNLAAIRSYARGVMSRRKFDYPNARGHFEAALASDSSSVDAQLEVAETWLHEGYQKKARAAIARLRAQPIGVTPRRMAEINASIQYVLSPSKGTEALYAIYDTTIPDDVEVTNLMFVSMPDPKTMSAILGRLRDLPAPASSDIRLDLLEGRVAWQLGNRKRADELFERTRARAKTIGARTEEGLALWEQATMLWLMAGQPSEALGKYVEAAELFQRTSEFELLAWSTFQKAYFLVLVGPPSRSLKALEESAALFRRLGNREALSGVLILLALETGKLGELDLAKRKLREALADSEAFTDSPRSYANGYYVSGWLAYVETDMDGLRKAVRMLRTEESLEGASLNLEGLALIAQDHFKEARETLEKEKTMAESGSNRILASVPASKLCSLACEEGHPDEGLACLAQYSRGVAVGGRKIGLEIARCRYLADDITGAENAAVAALEEAGRSELYEHRILSNVYLMRARAARGETAKAIASLRTDLADTERRKTRALAFEVALALGDVELGGGRSEGRARLVKLEQEAKSKEFFRIARLARQALDRYPVSAGARPVH